MRDFHAVLIEDCAAAAYTAEATGRAQLVAIPRRACCDVFQWETIMETGKRREFRLTGLSEPLSHYTDAVAWGDTLYVSGIAPLDSAGKLVGGEDAAAQTRQIFENMKLILEAAGASFADVLRVTVYLTDVSDRTRINPVRQAYFGSARPASTLIEVPALAIPGMKVEIEAIVGLRNA